jgi:hypothetical protein
MVDRTDYRRQYYQINKEQIKAKARNWTINNREKSRAIQRKYAKSRHERLKAEIFNLLGNKCSNPNCLVLNGCSDPRCLQIDHVHGRGKQEIRRFGDSTKYYVYILKQLKSGSKDYQLLCANCNWIKRWENSEFHYGLTPSI